MGFAYIIYPHSVSTLPEFRSVQLARGGFKGPVSGFVGLIPHPSLESRIDMNH